MFTKEQVTMKVRELFESIDVDGDLEEADQTVGKTILKQMGGVRRLSAMIGAKHFVTYGPKTPENKYGQGLGGVTFRFPRPGRGKPNQIKIILNGKDLYDVSFGSVKGTFFKVLKKFNDVPASNLKSLFERETGLYLSL